MTYEVYTKDNLINISRSNVHPVTGPNALKLSADHKNRGTDKDGFDCPHHSFEP